MDVFVMLLLTGSCAPSASFPHVYHFVKEEMTWYDARDYCASEHTALAQIDSDENTTAMMNVPTGGHADKAWIGLYSTRKWTWVDGRTATYFNWDTDQPNNLQIQFCVCMRSNGFWFNARCSTKKHALCINDKEDDRRKYFITKAMRSWEDAKTHCEKHGFILASVPNKKTKMKIQKWLPKRAMVWIGLNRQTQIWYWSGSRGSHTFQNWQPGQPDNQNGSKRCAAVSVKDGTWTNEQCNATFPFFCYAISWKRVVRMTIRSGANMEDPACSADLQRQLRAAFVNQGVTDFKLTWKKLPVKQTQESADD